MQPIKYSAPNRTYLFQNLPGRGSHFRFAGGGHTPAPSSDDIQNHQSVGPHPSKTPACAPVHNNIKCNAAKYGEPRLDPA